MAAPRTLSRREQDLEHIAKMDRQNRRNTLARVRADLKRARAAYRARLTELRALCREHKRGAREAVKARRVELVAAMREQLAAFKLARTVEARGLCEADAAAALAPVLSLVARRDKLAADLDEEARELRHRRERAAGTMLRARGETRAKAAARLRRELHAESDDEVRGNLSGELVVWWDSLAQAERRRFKGDRYKSRTEAAAEWAGQHPHRVAEAARAAEALDVARLEAAEEAHYRAQQEERAFRRRRAPVDLSDVPF